MKKNILRIILSLLLLGTFFMIFGFSSQDAKQSGGLSRKTTEIVLDKVSSIQELDKVKKEKIYDRAESVIRKIAHFSIYTAVGFLLMGVFSTYILKEKYKIFFSFVIGAIYASSDEIHQSFIPGRSAQVTDVILDSMGVLFGILIYLLLVKIIKLKIERKEI